ncbi:hypothetical protein ACFPAF_10205 [Hymenobacter endophyticus]|uniref:Uncharacterized protein n=1 Tax=Hymenobacter endophyticus TaxID=3076335 RepID=A0ABU3THB5_9BACT|nr:hypothetical protein [Hymenobacter endophyticus]MDU0370766.1 hypothetical protein [Hymenobacter endophyticus]
MKSTLALLLLIFLGSVLLQLALPWWSVVLLCLAGGAWWRVSAGEAFLAGLLGAGLSWWLPAAWLNTHGAGLLAARLATLLPLGGQPWLLVAISGLLLGLVGGLAALSGALLRRAIKPAVVPANQSARNLG